MLKSFVLICLLLVISFVLNHLLQRYFIYCPSKKRPNPKDYHAEDMQVIKIPVTEELTLNSWYKPALDDKPVILYLHGKSGHIGNRMSLARYFLSAGFGMLLLEYRGYGGNPGQPTELGFYQDGRAAMKFLLQQDIQKQNIVLYGESLGTGVATQLATEFPVCSLVLQSPYTSLAAVARYYYFGFPIPMRDKFDSLARIQDIHVPVLMLHGKLDAIVPYTQGITLFKHANQPKKWVKFTRKGHDGLWDRRFVRIVIDFINSHCTHPR